MDAELAAFVRDAVAAGVLDDQFEQLLSLADETNPDFVSEVATLYLSDTGDKLARLAAALAPGAPPPDLAAVDAAAHQLKGASASFGAAGVAAACSAARAAAAAGDAAGAAAGVGAAVAAFDAVRARMEVFAGIDARLRAARAG